ncbi:MAG: YfhO family protein [Chloroflexi bacterium]|nr:YfhO family protein [Chloroflexota bacterium]
MKQSAVSGQQSKEVASSENSALSSRNSELSTQHSALSTSNSELGTRNSPLIPILLLALTLLFFHRLAFSGLILARGDVYAYFYPYWHVRNAALMNGQLPLWSPDIFMGVPLLANSQVGTFYPPNWPLVPFDPPTGITISLLAHVVWALLGAYWLARRVVRLDTLPALLAAALFGLGGYLGAKAENINQLQALAWMPWIFGIFHHAICRSEPPVRPYNLRSILLLGIALALQTLPGHPQTVFITTVGLVVYGMTVGTKHASSLQARLGNALRPLLVLAGAGLIALLLASPQLVPMLELMGGSNRSSGLNPQQAMAFSLNPFVIGRGLLPSYDSLLFGEYVVYVGVIGLGLAIIGIVNGVGANRRFAPTDTPRRLPWVLLAIIGFGLALGLYNPLYWTLAYLPGFSFFRVPARWLALFALALAILAGIGLQSLQAGTRPRAWVLALVVLIVGGLAFSTRFTEQMAVDVIGPAVPTARSMIAWVVALAALVGATVGTRYIVSLHRFAVPVLCAAAIVELFFASRVLAYNEVTPPDTFTAQRFTISQLRAYAMEQTPPGRILSISGLQFDPGDADALIARYRVLGMSDLAIRIALVDTKMRETLAANLPLVWGVPSVDGFDGGVLPTGWYTQFTSLLLPAGELRTVDGRLREILAKEACWGACIPDQRWLNLTNTRYLITDKIYDLWHEDVAYDTQFVVKLETGGNTILDELPTFEATAIDLLYRCGDTDCCRNAACRVPTVTVTDVNGEAQALTFGGDESAVDTFRLARLPLPTPLIARAVNIRANSPLELTAVTLVDTRTGDFQPLTLGPWRRVLSSDVKLYENRDVLPRAFVVGDVLAVPDMWQGSEDTLALMRDPAFDPTQTAVIATDNNVGARHAVPLQATTEITSYTPTRVEITVSSDQDAYLILTDAYFPGWTATVNGQPTNVLRADVMFRAVPITAGESSVVFEYRPGWHPWALLIGGAAWLLVTVWLVVAWKK